MRDAKENRVISWGETRVFSTPLLARLLFYRDFLSHRAWWTKGLSERGTTLLVYLKTYKHVTPFIGRCQHKNPLTKPPAFTVFKINPSSQFRPTISNNRHKIEGKRCATKHVQKETDEQLSKRDYEQISPKVVQKLPKIAKLAYLLLSAIRENETFMSVVRDRLFLPFVNRPLYDPQNQGA